LRNVSDAPLALYSITASDDLRQTNNCGAGLLPGSSCSVILQINSNIAPTGTVTITSNSADSPQVFTVSKTPGFLPGIVESATYLAFPVQLVGTTSAPKKLVVTNLGSQPSTIDRVTPRGDFSQTNDCSVLQPLFSCTVNVTYTASSPGNSGTYLEIRHDNGVTGDLIFMYAAGSSNALDLSAASLNLGIQYVGVASLSRVVTVTNVSPEVVTVTGISVTGNFSETNTCTQALLPGASCRVAVRFTPDRNGWQTGALTIASLGPGGTQTVNLYGTGLIPSDLAVSPLQLDLYPVIVGQIGGSSVKLTNTSSSPLTISQYSLPAGFSQTNDCTNGILAAHAFCTVNVIFQPTIAGDYTGGLTITHSGFGSPEVVPILGASGVTALQFNPTRLVFMDQQVGTAAQQYMGITNYSNSPVTLGTVNVTGDFALVDNSCPATITPAHGCNLKITFQPTATGARSGSVLINASDSTSPHVVPLQGRGVGTGVVSLQPASLIFGRQRLGTTSSSQTLTLNNNGTGPLSIGGISASANFVESDNCNGSIQPGSSCQINVTFAPNISGILNATLSIQDDAAGGPHNVQLRGTGFDKLFTAISLTSSALRSTVGQTVTFTANVNGEGAPTGNVDFYAGSTRIGTAALNGGAAQFVDSSLGAGAYSITAVYGGDTNNLTSSSSALLQVVNRAISQIQLVSSANPATVGNLITFTANILPFAPGATGSVQFYDGSSLLATIPAVNGTAAFSSSALDPGLHAIKAVYGGDTSYSPSSSTAFQIVNRAGAASTQLVLAVTAVPTNAGALPGILLSRQGLGWSGQVSSATSGVFHGTITLIDGDTVVQSISVDTSGHAASVIPSLTIGSHSLRIIYTGDDVFGGSITDAVNIQRSPKPR